ncbi:MAG TPA: peptidylprolyl isomerase, partial [bacterium]|nr:peptidylprolyl isomerase [bacterium]
AASQPYVGDAYGIKEFALDAIMTHLEAAAGAALGLDRLPEVIWSAEKDREEFLMPKMEEFFRSQITIGPDDTLKYYNEHRSELVTPKIYRARRILVASQDSARAVMRELRSGKDFAEVAREKSTDSYTAAKGGDMGQVVAGMIAMYDSVLAGLQPGDITRPFTTTNGVEILKLEELTESRPLSFDEAREIIAATIVSSKANALLSAWVAAKEQEVGYSLNEGLLRRIRLPVPEWKEGLAKSSRAQGETGG